MDEKTLFGLKTAEGEAQAVVQALLPACHKIKIAGSIRRRKAHVHDVDIVIWPICEAVAVSQLDLFGTAETILMPVKLLEILRINGWWMRTPEDYPRKIELEPAVESDIVPIELYISEPDGSNYEALVQMRTGSEAFNISLADRAKRMGLHYKAGYGVFLESVRMDDGTEEGIFKALGLGYYQPELREQDYRMVGRHYGKQPA